MLTSAPPILTTIMHQRPPHTCWPYTKASCAPSFLCSLDSPHPLICTAAPSCLALAPALALGWPGPTAHLELAGDVLVLKHLQAERGRLVSAGEVWVRLALAWMVVQKGWPRQKKYPPWGFARRPVQGGARSHDTGTSGMQ